MNWLQHEEELEFKGRSYTVQIDSDEEHFDWGEVYVWEDDEEEWRELTEQEMDALADDQEWVAAVWRLHEDYEVDRAYAAAYERYGCDAQL